VIAQAMQSQAGDIEAPVQRWLRDHLKKEHHAIFDTALGAFPIKWEAHVGMMAAVQPFMSGAISKTINMPESSSFADIAAAYRMGHDLNLKAIAVYRDKCKLSQPLNLKGLSRQTVGRISPWIDPDSRMKPGPIRKPGIDVAAKLGPGVLYVKTSCYDDGRVAEIWATYTADQGLIQAMLTHVCKTANVSLQFGTPLRSIVQSWLDSVFEPRGMVEHHPYIKQASSITNLLGKIISYHVFGETDLLEVKPGEDQQAAVGTPMPRSEPLQARFNLTGESCPRCGSPMVVQSGANCKKCQQCGHSGGCG
jgi:ribonucleoside-diphosphate reductase alpha chain